MKISKSYLESTLNFITSQNSDKNWLDSYIIDLGFLDLRGLFELLFDFLKISKSYLETTLNFISSQNSKKSWLDEYL